MRLNLATGNAVMIGGDYGGEPPWAGLSRTWFNRALWDACKTAKARQALLDKVRRIDSENHAAPVCLGKLERP